MKRTIYMKGNVFFKKAWNKVLKRFSELDYRYDDYCTKKAIRRIKLFYGKRVKFGQNFRCRNGFLIKFNRLGCNDRKVIIGNGCFFNDNCSITCFEKIEIGDNSIFGEGVKIYDHNHRFNLANQTISSQGYTHEPVKIGKNCWIGSNVVILKGVIIGDNCVIGAGVILRESVPNNSIVTMNSATVINRIKYKELD